MGWVFIKPNSGSRANSPHPPLGEGTGACLRSVYSALSQEGRFRKGKSRGALLHVRMLTGMLGKGEGGVEPQFPEF